MRMALHDLQGSTIDIDDPKIVLSDAIEELLEKRQIVEDVRNFIQTWAPKLARR